MKTTSDKLGEAEAKATANQPAVKMTDDPRGPAIPVRELTFMVDHSLPGNFFGKSLRCDGTDKQKHWRAAYYPRIQFYELTYFPPPGTREPSITTMIPREWARYE